MAGERIVPGLMKLKAFFTPASSGWDGPMDQNLLRLSALSQLTVLSRTTALPGSPTDGVIYIVPSGGNADKIAARDNGSWVYLDPEIGLRCFVVDTLEYIVWTGTKWDTLPGLYATKVIAVNGGSPNLSYDHLGHTLLLNHTGPINFTIPKNSTLAIPVGAFANWNQVGENQVSFLAEAGATIHSAAGLKSAKQWAGGSIQKIGTDTWWLTGNTAT